MNVKGLCRHLRPVFFVLLPLLCSWRSPAAPANDDFANADAVSLTGEMAEAFGDNAQATLEPGETDYSAGWQVNSIWWAWTAPRSGLVRLSTAGSAFWAFFHVFTGEALTNLQLVAMGDSQRDATFEAQAGTVYRIRVVGSNVYGLGATRVAIYPSVPPNDAFASRTVLAPGQSSIMGTTSGATAELHDPVIYLQAGGHTVWYEWKAEAIGRLTLTATNLTSAPWHPRFVAGVFTGTQLDQLRNVASGPDGTSTMVTNGQTYLFGIDGDEGDFRLAVDFARIDIPSNDTFANRLLLSGPSALVTNDNTRATLERGEHEPAPHMAKATLWYEWTAPVSGYARMAAQGDGFVPSISVYRGNALSRLKAVANSLSMTDGAEALCSFQATAEQTYVIALDGRQANGRGRIVFAIDLTSLQLTSPSAKNAVLCAAAPPLFQINPPAALTDGQLQSVSYLAVRPDESTLLVGCATNAPFSITPTNLPPGMITFYALATNTEGEVRVSPPVLAKVRPANDDFALGQPLEGYQWQASGFTAQASRERGEPGGGAASVWWTWQAPSSGPMEIEAQLGESGPLRKRTLTVYTGPDVKHLKRVPCTKTIDNPGASSFFYFNAVGGSTYHLAVGASNPNLDPGTWPFLLRGTLKSFAFSAPRGQSFTEPADVPLAINEWENPGSIQRVDFLASDGYVSRQLIGSVTAAPYQMVWSNAPPGNYQAEACVTKSDGSQPLSATTTVAVRPLNDDFSHRIMLQTNFAWLRHRIAGATREPGEPAHNGNPDAVSAWWSWTAPAEGKLCISDPTGQTSAGLALYTGTNLSSLNPVPLSSGIVSSPSQMAAVSAGTPYQLALTPGSTPEVNFQLRFYPPPPNDNFSNRTVVSGAAVALEGYTVGSTLEPGEPDHGGIQANNSLWWSWTAPRAGVMTLQPQAGYWVVSSVYTGSSLALLQAVPGSGSSPLEVTGGTTYQIALASCWGEEEYIRTELNYTTTGTNDAFAARTPLEGTNLDFTANSWGASTEPGEPPPATGGSGRTLWWSWRAPADGNVYIAAQVSMQHPYGTFLLQTFTGETLDSLQELPGGAWDRLSFHAVSNQTYQIRFDAVGPVITPVSLTFIPAPPNDAFTHATALTGALDFSLPGTLRGASSKPQETPLSLGGFTTVWYSWTAPESGPVTVAAASFWLHAFTGSCLTNLTPAGVQNQGDSVVLEAQAGVTYYFAVAGIFPWEPDNAPSMEAFQLLLLRGGFPANDNFASAEWLTGTNASLVATNWGATLQPTDPPLVQWQNLKRTLWYQWQAPGSGLLQLTDAGSTVTPVEGVYLGTALNQLSMIGAAETPVRANEVVHILVDGIYGSGGVLKLGLAFTPAPPNDDFEQASPVTGTNVSLTANVRTATGQSANPWERSLYTFSDVWWCWTAPGAGHVVITNLQADANPSFFAYTGTSLSNLQLVAACANPGTGLSLEFDAAAGIHYYLRGTWGSGANADTLLLSLNETLTPGPAPSLSGHNAAGALQAASPRLLGNQRFSFQISGTPNSSYRIEYSSDLVHWQPFQAGVLTNSTQSVIDPDTSAAQTRFYRVVAP